MAKGSGDIRDPKLRNLMAAQCPECKEYFASDAAFQRHRYGDWDHRRCLARGQMDNIGMTHGARRLRMYGDSLQRFGFKTMEEYAAACP